MKRKKTSPCYSEKCTSSSTPSCGVPFAMKDFAVDMGRYQKGNSLRPKSEIFGWGVVTWIKMRKREDTLHITGD